MCRTRLDNGRAMNIDGIATFLNKQDPTYVGNNAVFRVKIVQIGGDQTKFGATFGAGDITCPLQSRNLSACSNMINKAKEYATHLNSAVNFNLPKTLYTFDYTADTYAKYMIPVELPPLPDAVQVAKKSLIDSISHDRTMLQYLQAYQRQTMMVNVDDITKEWLLKSTENYTGMIHEYENYNIINACYGDTNHLEKSCNNAVTQISNLHKKYQQYIDFANKMSLTIMLNSPAGMMRYIPARGEASCTKNVDKHMECIGRYVQFFDQYPNNTECSYCFHNTVICYIDTTSTASYITQI